MLYFPSTNSAAHTPADRDVTRLHALLDDDVWAFTNCRVDATGYPVAEIDWFFYNTRTGSMILSEWKRYPKSVSVAADVGEPWVLTDGSVVPNAIEQVTKQQRALRRAIERSVLPHHFPAHNQAKIAQCVYSPQISEATDIERLQFGRVHGALSALASAVQTLPSPSPLLLNDDDGARLSLARALGALFRCSISAEVEAKLSVPRVEARKSHTDVVRRVSEIHREIAHLHLELAELTITETHLPPSASKTVPATVQRRPQTGPAASAAETGAPITNQFQVSDETDRMKAHLAHAFTGVNGSVEEAKKALGRAWLAVLRDPRVHRTSGISFAVFGSAATPLVKAKHESVRKVVGMQLGKWCFAEAERAGLKPRKVPSMPSHIRVG